MQTLTHRRSGATILGVRLPPGMKISQSDLYDSSDGKWRTADSVAGGKVPVGDHVIWVRQSKPLSDNAKTLLSYLNMKPWGEKTCIGERNGTLYVIPSPTFNWDGRIDIQSQRVQHPECVQELVEYGYLTSGEHDVHRSESDYATSGLFATNEVYTLTGEGKQKGKEILATLTD